jgi:hypothetical protein
MSTEQRVGGYADDGLADDHVQLTTMERRASRTPADDRRTRVHFASLGMGYD